MVTNKRFNKIFFEDTLESNLVVASYEGNIELVRSILNQGRVDINSLVKHYNKHIETNETINKIYKTTALHCAAAEGYYQIAELLIKNAANPNAKDSRNCPPINEATYYNHLEIVKLLLLETLIPELDSALFIAATNNHLDIAELFIKHGANVNYKTEGRFPTSVLEELSTYHRYVDMANLLIKHGANVNESTNRGSILKLSTKDTNNQINSFTKNLLECPKTKLTDEIILPIINDPYIDNDIRQFINDVYTCETFYNKSNLKELWETFKKLSENVQEVFINRQINKFSQDINYYQNIDEVYKDLKQLSIFTNDYKNQQEFKSEFLDHSLNCLKNKVELYYNEESNVLTLKTMLTLYVKSNPDGYFNNGHISSEELPKTLQDEINVSFTVEELNVNIVG